MKKFTLIISIFFFISILSAKNYGEWTQAEIITDTNSVYKSPFISVYNGTSWLFYEKQEQRSSIYKMDLNDLENNVLMLGSETVNYKLPLFYFSGGSDFLGYLFYLSDEEGFNNLYAAKLFENDSLGLPIKVVQNPENNNFIDYSLNFNGYITYTIDSLVYAAELKFTWETVYTEKNTLLDSASFNIQVNYSIASWQKIENDSSHIKSSQYVYNPDSAAFFWGTPKYSDSTGDCRWLISSPVSEFMETSYSCWVKWDTVHGIFGHYAPYLDTITLNTYSKPDVRHISLITWFIGVKKLFWAPHYLCFATGQGDSSEVFCSQNNLWGETGVYLSNNDYPDDNPKVFFGEEKNSSPSGWSQWVYCIWQTHINGKTALSMSKNIADFTYSIKENITVDNILKVLPNPFHGRLNIRVNTFGEKANVNIYNVGGMQMASFNLIDSNKDWQSLSWQPSTGTPGGIYFVVVSLDGSEYVKKVLLSY